MLMWNKQIFRFTNGSTDRKDKDRESDVNVEYGNVSDRTHLRIVFHDG